MAGSYIGMQPKARPLTDKKRPLVCEQGESFLSKERRVSSSRASSLHGHEQGKVLGWTLHMLELFFSWQATILLQEAEMQDKK